MYYRIFPAFMVLPSIRMKATVLGWSEKRREDENRPEARY